MYLKDIALQNFRNYESLELSFSPSINVLIGENAQGKTNLIESIYFLAMSRSHRTSKDRELIRWESDFAKVKGELNKKSHSVPMEIILSKRGKNAKLNHLEQKKLSNYIGQLNVILFAPEDLSLVKGSPSIRRKFIDMELGQMNKIYLHHLVQYQQILKQRNQFLKQAKHSPKFDQIYLDVLTEQLAAEGAEVLFYRFKFVNQLNAWAQQVQIDISNGKEHLKITYKALPDITDELSIEEIFNRLKELYKSAQQQEIDQGTTTLGPHRDDLIFYVNGKNVQRYGSQGQQRTTALSLKLAEIELMNEITGEYPILLLDDVLSELDDSRQTHLLSSIQNKVQTFITTTSLDGVQMELLNHPLIFYVDEGTIINKENEEEINS
ncbi:MAG TPA: DNA replication/repair protein RecF [Candidatus Atopostipes pullistercoris]|uniref:DNA replication and repair protein RecF n=1 Tax=Candidatus Atopostipes pullistercoris TaxID=2838467 RepID=A0A9D2G1E3_9LACT|nr:DNA replication/repair protein RecF [Candidatus Atopostipes pullistercoris]